MSRLPAALLDALRTSSDFESIAVCCLSEMLAAVQRAIDASAFEKAAVKRGMLHLRPAEGYAGLFVLEAGATALSAPGGKQALLPSASAWAHIVAKGSPVAVDVGLRLLFARDSEPEAMSWSGGDGVSEATQARLLERDATHVYVLPMYAPGGLFGMVSLEVACSKAVGTSFVWDACAAELEEMVTVAAPYLKSLPRRVSPDCSTGDEMLPVVGPTMTGVVNVLRAFSAEEETLLINGETGTGKSRMARWCHAHSARSDGPFEVLDLLSLPEETQMGELFGWRRGAFTGAVKDHKGYVARADGGTLFLDEIDKLSLKAQAALLFLLEERRYRVLGDDGEAHSADVRFVVGTNTDLLGSVRAGRFREDLYYRINVLPMRLPPLRERRDEIAAWARFMLGRRHGEKDPAREVHLDDSAVALLEAAQWPGNLRELDNVMRRTVAMAAVQAEAGHDIRIDREHLEKAHDFAGTSTSPGALANVASALAELLDHLDETDGRSVSLDAAMRGMLAAELLTRDGSLDRLGLTPDSDLRQAATAAASLYRVLGDTPPAALDKLERQSPPSVAAAGAGLTEPAVLSALERVGYRRAKAAALLGVSRSSLYNFIARTKIVPKVAELTRADIERARQHAGGDLDAMAKHLRVSAHGLKLRLQALDQSVES